MNTREKQALEDLEKLKDRISNVDRDSEVYKTVQEIYETSNNDMEILLRLLAYRRSLAGKDN